MNYFNLVGKKCWVYLVNYLGLLGLCTSGDDGFRVIIYIILLVFMGLIVVLVGFFGFFLVFMGFYVLLLLAFGDGWSSCWP